MSKRTGRWGRHTERALGWGSRSGFRMPLGELVGRCEGGVAGAVGARSGSAVLGGADGGRGRRGRRSEGQARTGIGPR